MARTHGRIMTQIWSDPDFLALPPEPQRLYLFLLSQPDLNQAGLLPLRARRWAQKYAGGSAASVRDALEALETARFVVVDEDTEEVLVRTFVRNDGVYKQPKVMLRALADATAIESTEIRRVWDAELAQLPVHVPRARQKIARSTRAAVVARDGWTCRICGEDVTPGDEHLDHVLPVSMGGSNRVSNLRLTHASCNLRRGAAFPTAEEVFA